ncbi:winged helix-turn-helix transcriptional regulator [Methylovirgula sp. 4M-Z18]|uniref:winged helix-turn-helix transcriptional regulator n=1 Tax=Methylovirgula sp. 4M-Z18 TaxID=2293567 RepID=UPI000E2F8B58|nr:helix-turn-helix domain-containing protein [Methylovirgula sp. 4M-Z18]RFB81427.1 transcriptional regulator [Methylovirgula sp. 4M-Z18]
MGKARKAGGLDPAAICRSSDPMAVRELLSKIGDTWTIFVILSLDLLGGRARFSELERSVPGISQRMLSSTLKNLERDGLVIREVFAEVPPRVEYEMTALGKSLLRPTLGLVDWAKANWEQVRQAQSDYDAP